MYANSKWFSIMRLDVRKHEYNVQWTNWIQQLMHGSEVPDSNYKHAIQIQTYYMNLWLESGTFELRIYYWVEFVNSTLHSSIRPSDRIILKHFKLACTCNWNGILQNCQKCIHTSVQRYIVIIIMWMMTLWKYLFCLVAFDRTWWCIFLFSNIAVRSRITMRS